MDVRQCPRCELRFEHEAELKSHMVIDHNLDPEGLEGDYPADDSASEVADVVEAGAEETTTGQAPTAPATDTGR